MTGALGLARSVDAAQKQFFVFESPASEMVPAGIATNTAITLTYSNASGTINNAVFTNGVSVTPAGLGVTAVLSSTYAGPINSGGGTTNLTLTISMTSNAPANTTFQIVVSATNNSFTANASPGVASITNVFMTGAEAYSNAFSMMLSPGAAVCRAGTTTNFSSTVTFVDHSATISGTVTNNVSVSGPDLLNVTASLNNRYAILTNNFGQTNLTLTVNVNSNAAPGDYAITVTGTNSAFTDNPGPGAASASYNLTVSTVKEFSLGLSPQVETILGGAVSHIAVTVTVTNLSTMLAEPVACGVTVSGPNPGNVTAGLSAGSVFPTAAGGTVSFTLSITNNDSSLPGIYQVVVGATNGDFTDNVPVPGIALATNLLAVTSPPLSIQHFSLSGKNMDVTGVGGGPNGQYLIYSSTNLVFPLSQWTHLLTNTFDLNGNFNTLLALSNTLYPNAASQFFAVVSPAIGTNPVATPVFSPLAGPFFAATPVNITSATSNAIIRYTTDGTVPSETNGIIYTGPVMMLGPVNTHQSGTVSNASGVTMLKAIAYRGGMPDSAVWTGIYNILDAVDYPPAPGPSPLVGVAHLAYNVSISNWNNILSLWTNYYGFAPMIASNNFVLIKINDQQFVELNQAPFLVSNQWQQANLGFEVTNAELYREMLASNGVAVPPAVTTNFLGNLSFFTVDPDGHTNEWVQYLSNSITGLSRGRFMPGTIVAGFANDLGVWTTDETLTSPRNYYVNQCGFIGSGNQVYFPGGGKRYIELLTTGAGGPTQATSGKHGKIQFMNFRGLTLFQTLNTLTNRDTSIPYVISLEGTSNSILHYAFDVYDSDLSRIRINDE